MAILGAPEISNEQPEFTIDDFEMINYDTKKIQEQNPQLKFELGI